VVAAACLTMIALGIWQLQRSREKEALLARYDAARGEPPIAFPMIPTADEDLP
jgi:surfeit locus 1 family protein